MGVSRQGAATVDLAVSMKQVLSACLACSLIFSLQSVAASDSLLADSKAVSAVEYLYADASDANTILAAIDSGLLKDYEGKDHAAWQKIYDAKRTQLATELDG